METIKNYLDAMFANMPNTPEVKKAKEELFTMMEDKYSELIAEGETENSAVGTVISEFGNLDELAEDLGLEKEVKETHEREAEKPRRFISMDEVKSYLESEKRNGILVGIGVMLCIMCVVPPILGEFLWQLGAEKFGVIGLFLFIAVAVGLFVFSGVRGSDWDFIKKEPCQIDMNTAAMVNDRKKSYKTTHALIMAVGVLLCAFCWVPVAILNEEIYSCFLFISIAIGVFLFIYTGTIMGSYEQILKVNDSSTMSGTYGKEGEVVYINKVATAIMEVYWTSVTCIYLSISFITFSWGTTWIIWPVAAILHKILMIALVKED